MEKLAALAIGVPREPNEEQIEDILKRKLALQPIDITPSDETLGISLQIGPQNRKVKPPKPPKPPKPKPGDKKKPKK